jgi:leucyl/phenylalanyl-tRNA--protein transferase
VRLPALEVVVARVTRPAPVGACRFRFPDPRAADSDGLLATGGDFEPATLLAAYRQGVFPWPVDGVDLLWWSPDPRAILPPDGLHVSRSLARTLRRGRFRVTIDAAFDDVLAACAEPRATDDETWITPAMRNAYARLHRLGWAHSVEVWADGALAGGLYGVAIGAFFAAESMFHRARDASKVALVALAQHARAVGVRLVDVQMPTPHLTSMGAVATARERYLEALAEAVACDVAFTPEFSGTRGVSPVE